MEHLQTNFGVLNPKDIMGLTGLEIMQGIQQGKFPAATIANTLNYTLQSVKDGEVVFRGAPGETALNPLGTVHGGWYGTLLDSAMACAVMTKLPAYTTYTTLEYRLNIIRSIPVGTLVDTIGITDHVGRSTGVAHGRIVGVADGKLYATGSTTCIVMPLKR